MKEYVEITTPYGVLGVRYAGSREEQPTELHIESKGPVKLGRSDYFLSFYMELAQGFRDEERMWRIAVGSVNGRPVGSGRNLSAGASQIVHNEIRQLLTAWLQQDSVERARAMVLWFRQRADDLDAEADRLDTEADAARDRAAAFLMRAAALLAELETC